MQYSTRDDCTVVTPGASFSTGSDIASVAESVRSGNITGKKRKHSSVGDNGPSKKAKLTINPKSKAKVTGEDDTAEEDTGQTKSKKTTSKTTTTPKPTKTVSPKAPRTASRDTGKKNKY
jgi:hypothetical protein